MTLYIIVINGIINKIQREAMHILKKRMKEKWVTVRLESLDDLWHLERLLEKGDVVTASTLRKTSVKRGSEIEYGEKRPMTLTLQVEKLEFHKDSHSLRIMGPITAGPEDVQLHSYHSIAAVPGLVLTIQKEQWKSHHLERLALAKTQEPIVLICLIDRERADFAGLQHQGIAWLGSIEAKKVAKKAVGSKQERSELFYQEIVANFEKHSQYQTIIVAGPGFERENLQHFIQNTAPGIAKKIHIEHASSIGKTGVQEVMKTSVNKVLKQTRVVKETQLIEQLFIALAKNGQVMYGKGVQKAIEYGAVETLLVSEEHIKEYEQFMEQAEQLKGKIMIISTEHEAGERFLSIGGIAAFLRFKLR